MKGEFPAQDIGCGERKKVPDLKFPRLLSREQVPEHGVFISKAAVEEGGLTPAFPGIPQFPTFLSILDLILW